MVSLEKLKALRAKEAERWGVVAERLALEREKEKIRRDIKNIRSARLRHTFGFSNLFKPVVQPSTTANQKPIVEKATKASGGIAMNILKGLAGFHEASMSYYGLDGGISRGTRKKVRKRKKAKTGKKKIIMYV